jgi:FK506-binding nuclear protein
MPGFYFHKKPVKQADMQKKKKQNVNGVEIEEIRIGHGAEAKKGKQVQVYYSGKLKQNGKQFDACLQGKPFKFRLGASDVIRGWDIGVMGMKVGGKRTLTIPPNLAYGNKRVDIIPANSTLVFDVELKAVN